MPKKSSVLIFDSCNQHVLMDYVKKWNPEVLNVRGEKINIPIFIKSLFKGGSISEAYKDCFIRSVNPKLIMTFIDNDCSFYMLAQKHPKVKTLFIQNGLRGYYADVFEKFDKPISAKNDFKVHYMLTFGSVIGEEYKKHVNGTVVPIGSLKNNQVSQTQPPHQGWITFVSQWHENGFFMGDCFFSQKVFFEDIDRPILQFLKNYAEKNNKKLKIIPRNLSQGNSQMRLKEEAYYRDILKIEPDFIEPQGIYPSYQAMDAAEVVVSVDSTMGYESVARGKKTAIFSTRTKLLNVQGLSYGWPGNFPDEGPFWTNNSSPESFNRIMDYLFNTSQDNWKKDVEESSFSSLMVSDPGNSIFKSILKKELESTVLGD